ncbi:MULTISPECIES: Dam family site-specific DNA-(adenine-N6)-methyltransferase [unclassified Mesorhizobium]|uniref:DNA adenine methylase n=1 Tax=unclassified Mesorhizobium TaxID=325217 RepID=UPI00112D933B|nr:MULTISPECIES: Dam family site-specific DNA-(adenine-N6)-methyltransferase [unclassified Mesorhizobium]TPN47743.1 Dam family site-specific DNA-(adenine-N6)-methyltransferase [Mesorhizobium sp. B1-1-7]TPN58394.1 Dam family site-specific DNA-(adenine-N6)-methyltransferase [Mesorhizobium sp. B1-1-9]
MGPAQKKLLRWAGSKSSVAARLEKHIDFSRNYVEPFAGSAVMFFNNLPRKASLNDLNPHLISLYQDVQHDPRYVWSIYNRFEISRDSYNECRKEFNSTRKSKKKSALFLFLNHFCFNGIYRTNQRGHFNTPYGGKKLKLKLTLDELLHISDLIKNVQFSSLDFETFLKQYRPEGSCIYIDPPYFTNEARVFREYGPGIFCAGDLKRLFVMCEQLSKENNKIVVSYRDCKEFMELFGSFVVDRFNVTRNIGGFQDRRKIQQELIAVFE